MFHHIKFIYFDLDDTLLDFTNASKRAFAKLLAHYQLSNEKISYDIYQIGNHKTWIEFEQNKISSQELRSLRFKRFLSAIHCSRKLNPLEMNQTYILYLIDETTLIPGATELIHFFKGKIPMGILTNGLKEAQRPRLMKAALFSFFNEVIVSDEIGISKPNPSIFDFARRQAGNISNGHILLIGDNPYTDIQPAQKAGFKTIWYNPDNKILPEDIRPELVVSCLTEILPSFALHPYL
jgi:YjjG family noncanonical pyrimidine nucleotidase